MNFSDASACLPAKDVLFMAYFISKKYNFPRIDVERFMRAYDDPENDGPYILYNQNRILWMDRYYTAYVWRDRMVHYSYITWHHVLEEMESLEKAKGRSFYYSLAAEIQLFFQEPVQYMRDRNTPIWIAPAFLQIPAA